MRKYLGILVVVTLGFFAACSSSGGATTHTSADMSSALSVYETGLTASEMNYTGTTGTAYSTMGISGTIYSYTCTLNGYSDGSSGVTMSGTLTVVYDSSTNIETLNGTLSFSGSTEVSSFTFNSVTINLTSSAMSGTWTVAFNDGTSGTYNFATGTYTQS
jgi:hypothetical protein